ncbi:MAG: FprA family A-type flavoprotein, partial [Deltaproteobacteria bacterium]|nr:FprA family A-type flavoprotein [Deltaproteobacteria bacterium]
AYLVEGSAGVALLDTVDPERREVLLYQLADVPRVDWVVVHHVEQDHAGALPDVLALYPAAKVLCTAKARDILVDHLPVDPGRIRVVADGEEIDLGGKTLRFLHMPWVHWPETMVTWLPEDRILFSCDFLGSHLATSDLYVTDRGLTAEAAKRYYAEIMMPFRKLIRKHLDRLAELDIAVVAPSHGPLHDDPAFILEAYRDWTGDAPKNEVVVPYISMHGSTARMVEYLVAALAGQGITVRQFDLAVTDIGKLAISLVDAATIVIATPTVHSGPHPSVFFATHLANALRPKLRFASVIGSYGWGTQAVERLAGLIPNLAVELLDPVMVKGLPRADTFAALDRLAGAIEEKHRSLGLL